MLDFVLYTMPNYTVNWHHELLCKYLDRFARKEIRKLMVFMPPQHGKQISNNQPILTNSGWKKHGDLKVSDIVFGRYGQPVRVEAISEETNTEFIVEFSDGEKIECHGNHEWIVYDCFINKWKQVETKYLFQQKISNRFAVDEKRFVVSIIPVLKSTKGRCIQVEGGIYLVGKKLIPTHNSQLVSRHFPAFLLGENPDFKIVGISYAADLATSFNRAVQRIIGLNEYADVFPETTLNSKNIKTDAKAGFLRNADIFEVVNHLGSYKSVGIGGALTGNPADIGIIDDPVKDQAEAKSVTIQQRNWDWYNDVYSTRLHNDSQTLLTMTRWDENDLAGKILKAEPGEWTILSLPGIKEDNTNPEDPRKIGEALWEEKHSKEKILKVRNQSKRTYLALYQQKPKQVASGGEYFFNFQYTKHVTQVKFIKGLPIHLTFDFNSKPYMTLVLIQVLRLEAGYQIRVFKEYCLRHPRNHTQALCEHFLEDFGHLNPDIFYYGDAMGERRIEGKGDEKRFDDVRKYLKKLLSPHSKRTKGYNISVIKRKEFMNKLLFGYDDNMIIIDESCTETIADFENLLEDKDGGKWTPKVTDPDNSLLQYEKHGHTSDAVEYQVSYIFKDEILKPKN